MGPALTIQSPASSSTAWASMQSICTPRASRPDESEPSRRGLASRRSRALWRVPWVRGSAVNRGSWPKVAANPSHRHSKCSAHDVIYRWAAVRVEGNGQRCPRRVESAAGDCEATSDTAPPFELRVDRPVRVHDGHVSAARKPTSSQHSVRPVQSRPDACAPVV